MKFLSTLFSSTGVLIAIYVLIGVFANTMSPHVPEGALSATLLHSWVQYIISIAFWPLSYWHPTFTVGQWTPTGSVFVP